MKKGKTTQYSYATPLAQVARGLAIALLSSVSLGSLGLSPVAIAQVIESGLESVTVPSSAPARAAQLPTALEFVPPELPDRGRPRGRSSGTASRGTCEFSSQLPLTALVPVTKITPEAEDESAINITYDFVFSLTTQANPTFWFHVPYHLTETPVEFVLKNEQKQTLYQATYQANVSEALSAENDTGVVNVSLPEDALALAVGDRYHWYFMVYCDEQAPSFVEGWIERVPLDPALAADLAEASSAEKARLYAQKGIWQDALTQVGTQRLAEEQSAFEDWTSLLSSIGLEAFAPQPLVDCCEL